MLGIEKNNKISLSQNHKERKSLKYFGMTFA